MSSTLRLIISILRRQSLYICSRYFKANMGRWVSEALILSPNIPQEPSEPRDQWWLKQSLFRFGSVDTNFEWALCNPPAVIVIKWNQHYWYWRKIIMYSNILSQIYPQSYWSPPSLTMWCTQRMRGFSSGLLI